MWRWSFVCSVWIQNILCIHSFSIAWVEDTFIVTFLPSLFHSQFGNCSASQLPSSAMHFLWSSPLPISHVLSMLLGQAVKSPFAWSAHTTVRLSCQDITTSSPDYWCNLIIRTSPSIAPSKMITRFMPSQPQWHHHTLLSLIAYHQAFD